MSRPAEYQWRLRIVEGRIVGVRERAPEEEEPPQLEEGGATAQPEVLRADAEGRDVA